MELADVFRPERHWRTVPSTVLRVHSSAIVLMTPAGAAFYLPAYMLEAVTNFAESDVIPEVLIRFLTVNDRNKRALMEMVSLLSSEQRGIVRAFVEYCNQREPDTYSDLCQAAVSSYWWQEPVPQSVTESRA